MTNDDKAHQLGTLMIELESTEREASQYREKVKLFKDTLRAAADGDLRSALTEHNMTDTNPLKPGFRMTDEARGHSERFRAMTRDTLTMLIQHAEQLRDHGVLEALHDALNRIKAEGRR